MKDIFTMTREELEAEAQVLQEELLEADEIYTALNNQIKALREENLGLRAMLARCGRADSDF